MEKRVSLSEAKSRFSALVTEAETGAEITITRHGHPVARIVSAQKNIVRTPGDWGWSGSYDESVFAPETDEDGMVGPA